MCYWVQFRFRVQLAVTRRGKKEGKQGGRSAAAACSAPTSSVDDANFDDCDDTRQALANVTGSGTSQISPNRGTPSPFKMPAVVARATGVHRQRRPASDVNADWLPGQGLALGQSGSADSLTTQLSPESANRLSLFADQGSPPSDLRSMAMAMYVDETGGGDAPWPWLHGADGAAMETKAMVTETGAPRSPPSGPSGGCSGEPGFKFTAEAMFDSVL